MNMKTMFVTALLTVALGTVALAQPPEMDEQTKKWVELGTPGEAHKLLDQFVGTWEVAAKSWMAGPDQPPVESKGISTVKWALGGRFLQEDMTSEMMGQPMQGIGYTGYDNFKKRYVGSWMDNLSTGIYTMEGSYDPQSKGFAYCGLMDDLMTGEHDQAIIFLTKITDPNQHVFEMYELRADGKHQKTMEMTYTRKK